MLPCWTVTRVWIVSESHCAAYVAVFRIIRSSQVEGACKSMVRLRFKQTGTRWKVRNLNRMLSLCAWRYSNAWEDYWRKAT